MAASIDIVIPVYNEAENIRSTLLEIAAQVRVPYKIRIVYDRDDDTTLPVAGAVCEQEKIPFELVKNKFGRGALNAIKSGLLSGSADYVIVTMADLSDPPQVMNQMFEMAERSQAAVVCGSRYMKGGSQIGGPFLKRTLSRIAGLSLHYLVGLPTHDVTNSFKLYRREIFEKMEIESEGGFELGMEIVVKAHALGFLVTEVPTSWRDRSAGESRFRLFRWLPEYLRWYFYALRNRGHAARHSMS